jgi:hypothetical protein
MAVGFAVVTVAAGFVVVISLSPVPLWLVFLF